MQFLLGVDAPVSFLLAPRDPRDDRAQRAHRRCRVYALVRRSLAARPARGPAPPPPPRVHDRRPVARCTAHDASRPPTTAARRSRRSSRCASRSSAAIALRAVRDRLLPPLVPAGALGRPVPRRRRATTACARCASRRRAARSSTATAASLVENRVATVVDARPREAARRPSAPPPPRWGQHAGRRALRPKGKQGPPVAIPPPADARAARALINRLGADAEHVAAGRSSSGSCSSLALVPYANVTREDRRRRRPTRNYLAERPELFPGRQRRARLPAPVPAAGRSPRRSSARSGEIAAPSSSRSASRASRRARSSARAASSAPTTATCAAPTAPRKITIDALGRPKGDRAGARGHAGRASCAPRSTSRLQQTGQKDLAQAIAQTPGSAGAFVAMDPRNGEVLAMGSLPTFDPSDLSRADHRTTRYERALRRRRPARPLFNRAIGGAYPTGSTFKPITALAGLATGADHAGHGRRRHGLHHDRRDKEKRCNAKSEVLRPGRPARRRCRSPRTSTSTSWACELNGEPGQPLQKWARRLGPRAHTTGIDLPGEFERPRARPRVARTAINQAEAKCRKKKHHPCGIADGTNRALERGRQRQPRDRPGRPAGHAAADGRRLRGDRERRHASSRPHLGLEVEDANGRAASSASSRGRPRKVAHRPGQPRRRSATACTTPRASRRHVAPTSSRAGPRTATRSTARPAPRERNDQPTTSPGTSPTCPTRSAPIVVAATVEEGGFGADGRRAGGRG